MNGPVQPAEIPLAAAAPGAAFTRALVSHGPGHCGPLLDATDPDDYATLLPIGRCAACRAVLTRGVAPETVRLAVLLCACGTYNEAVGA